MRKFAFGILWFVAIYFGLCMAAGAIAGMAASQTHPGDLEVARQAGERVVANYLPFFIGGALTLSIAGAGLGFLPGTRDRHPAA